MEGLDIRKHIIFTTLILIISTSLPMVAFSQLQVGLSSEFELTVEEGWSEVIVADIGEDVGHRALEISDVDNDSLNEIVVGLRSFDGSQLRYYEYESSQWVETVIADTLAIATISIGDLDGDDYDEILVGGADIDYAGAELQYFEFDGENWVSNDIIDSDIGVWASAIGDLDNDGVNEVAAGYEVRAVGYELRYYEYNGETWNEYFVDDELGEADGIEIADIDHDGDKELVYLGSSVSNTALCYYEKDGGSWNKTVIPCYTGWEMDTGDVDNDGEIEIAWGNCWEPENEVRVYDYVEDSWVEVNVSDMNGCAEGTGIYHVAIGDVDNDGFNELAIGAERPFFQVRYFEYVEGIWIGYNISTTLFPAQVVKIGDVDNDGANELLVGLCGYYDTSSDHEIRYYEEIPSTTTTSEPTSETSITTTTTSPTTTDFDQLDPLLIIIGVGIPIGVIFVIVLWKSKKSN